jgi:hypothetical protein
MVLTFYAKPIFTQLERVETHSLSLPAKLQSRYMKLIGACPILIYGLDMMCIDLV